MPSDALSPYADATRRSRGRVLRDAVRSARFRVARALIRAAFIAAKGFRRPYQPVAIGGAITRARARSVRDAPARWQAIADVLRAYGVRSVLDIGCAEGFFVRRAAEELGLFAIGVEASDRLMLGELARLYDRVPRAAAVRALVGAEELCSWPRFDAVILMSVAHHIVRAEGLKAAETFIAAAASRAEKIFIFEMGTAEETSWAPSLPALDEGQERYIAALLSRCGLTGIRAIATTGAYQKGADRLLFAAEPAANTSRQASGRAHGPGAGLNVTA